MIRQSIMHQKFWAIALQRWVSILLWVVSGWIMITHPAHAAICRTVDHHRICILEIKRSAKYYWEYRASVSIDGDRTPIEIYNCRDRTKQQEDGSIVPFRENGAGPIICQLVHR